VALAAGKLAQAEPRAPSDEQTLAVLLAKHPVPGAEARV
jgi:hypothetical protein